MYLLKEMEYLENSMMHMADLVVSNLTIAFDAYLNYQPKEYIINDDIIDNQEIMIEGVLSIQAGESPALIERKLECYILDKKPKKDE